MVSKSLQFVEVEMMRVAMVTHELCMTPTTAEAGDTEGGEVLRDGC